MAGSRQRVPGPDERVTGPGPTAPLPPPPPRATTTEPPVSSSWWTPPRTAAVKGMLGGFASGIAAFLLLWGLATIAGVR